MTNDQRIEFIVRFGAENLDYYRAGDWLNLRDDINSFLGRKAGENLTELVTSIGGYFMPMTQRFPEDMSERELRALQKDVHTIIEYFAGPGKKNTIVSSPGLTAFKGTAVEVTLGYFAQGSPAGAIIQRIGKTRDCVLGLTIALLERAKASPIMRCSQCDKIFYRRGKMMFCSRTCTNREMAQRKRAGHSKPRTKKTQAKKKSRKG